MPFIAARRPGASTLRCPSVILAIFLAACGSGAIAGIPVDGTSQNVSAAVGQDVVVTLWNVGPGSYTSPPAVSSNALAYLGTEIVPAVDSTGPLQRFRFRAAAKGLAVVDFRRVANDSVMFAVEDSVFVH